MAGLFMHNCSVFDLIDLALFSILKFVCNSYVNYDRNSNYFPSPIIPCSIPSVSMMLSCAGNIS